MSPPKLSYRWVLLPVFLLFASSISASEVDLHLSKQIDSHIEAALAKWNVVATDICSDAEFIRRIHLDLTGRIPEANGVRDFLGDADPGKRQKLISQLLASDAFAKYMSVVFDVMLMERRPDKYVTTDEWRNYLAKSFSDNKPLDVLAGEILGADGVAHCRRRPIHQKSRSA